ncbi:MAG: glycosyltransferase [Bacteroidales bacterium]|nr:glycosyltransferase [Bacteroidales bacterium]
MHKHFCIVSPSLKMGGIERALVVLANHFAERGYNITFISCLKGEHFYSLSNKIVLIEPNFSHKGGQISGIVFYPRLIQFIRRHVQCANPDVVLAFGDWFSPMVLLALYGTEYPVYISDRTSPDYKFKFPIHQLKKWLYPRSAGFIAQTQRAADFKRLQFGNKLNIKIIPNALREVILYPEIRREKIILYVGRFAWEKGPDRLIQAFAKITDKGGWELHMAGSGPLLGCIKQLTIELGIESLVKFLGRIEDVDYLFARASIYVLPSVLEGFPNSLCEAMAAGLPVVCFNTIPHESILTNGVDGLVLPDHINALTTTLGALLTDEDKRIKLGIEALKIKDRLNVEKVGNQIVDFIFTK